MSNSSLTNEQAMIVDCDFDNILLINAYAGTGKTSTLIRFCEKRAEYKILYLSYNSSMRVEAEAKFKHLKNVYVKTMHSLAYESVVDKEIKVRLGNLRAFDLNDLVQDKAEEKRTFYARTILNLLRLFCNTGFNLREFIAEIKENPEKYDISPKADMAYIGDKIVELWRNEIPNNAKLAYEHDFYLKAFQLSKPELDYDFILVDEAQDINGCVIDIVLNQKCKKVFIGDTYQSIYKFRGACNSLELLAQENNVKTFYLTQSFRCPLSVSEISNYYLQILGAKKDFKGTLKEQLLGFEGKTKGSERVIITRTNAKLFDIAVQNLDKKLFFVGGMESYNFDDLLDVQNLFCQNKDYIKSSFIAQFDNIKELIAYIEESKELDLRQKLLICFKYMDCNIFNLIKQIKTCVVKKQDNAELILSTGHKSKGLEWDKVEVADDFINIRDMLEKTKDDIEIPKEELNLFYVVLTRSKKELILDESYLIDNALLNACKKRITLT